jgi:Pyruvate/2-oxoacid:ferredoxin oxidoreductase gamma subunit
MTDRAVLMSGIGGQGLQLAAKTLALAAIGCGIEAMLFGTYGGSMRGGSTDVDMVLSRNPIRTPPVLHSAWAALVMHHQNWSAISGKLQSGGFALIDSSVFRGDFRIDGVVSVPIPTSAIAQELGSARAGAMVALGAFNAVAGFVTLDALIGAASEALPPYRRQHIAANERALRAGHEAVAGVSVPAWAETREVAA